MKDFEKLLNLFSMIISGTLTIIGVVNRDSFTMQLGLGLCIMNVLISIKGNRCI